MRAFFFLVMVSLLLLSCSPSVAQSTSTPVSVQQPLSTSTEISEESSIITEQAMAAAVKTEGALTRAALPTFTPWPTLTPTTANLPTLTPIPNSTPAGKGAYFPVSSDVLGSHYEIENACYFDSQSGWERYEIYAGAVAGSGDEYSAQGVVIVLVFRMVDRDGEPAVELADTKEYLTLSKEGPLRLPAWENCGDDWMLLTTPLNFRWFLHPSSEEFYQYYGIVPLARLEVAEKTQSAELQGESPVLPTNPVPLTGQFPFTAHLLLPLEIPPDRLSMAAMLVSPSGTLIYDNASDNATKESVGWWSDGQLRNPPIQREIVNLGSLPLLSDQEITLSLEPGFYVLMVYASWADVEWYGHVGAEYNFLIEVRD